MCCGRCSEVELAGKGEAVSSPTASLSPPVATVEMFARSRSHDKGKGRATEHSPLLPSSTSAEDQVGGPSSSSYSDLDPHAPSSSSPSRRIPLRPPRQPSHLKSHLLTFLYVFPTLLVALSLALVVLASSLASSTRETEQLSRSVVWRGPDEVTVLNVTEADGIWVEVKAWVGVDTDVALGFDGQRDREGNWWERIRRSWARWGVGQSRPRLHPISSPL